jgi:predicted SnoaL-like aldol condensation-catalyzing enzyme
LSEDNKAVFRRYVDLWARGEVARLDEVLGPGYVGHSGSNPDWDERLDDVRQRIAAYHAAHPSVRIEIHSQTAEGDQVATRMSAREVNPATGQEAVAAGFNVSRFADGKVIEEWALWERLG